MKKLALIFVLFVVVTLVLTCCDGGCEVVCCKTVEYWWGSSRTSCKTVNNKSCGCPEGYTVQSILSYPDWQGE